MGGRAGEPAAKARADNTASYIGYKTEDWNKISPISYYMPVYYVCCSDLLNALYACSKSNNICRTCSSVSSSLAFMLLKVSYLQFKQQYAEFKSVNWHQLLSGFGSLG